jgi:hypothetical protein
MALPLTALKHKEVRDRFKQCDVILGLDQSTDGFALFYEEENLRKNGPRSESEPVRILVFSFDQRTSDREALYAACIELKHSRRYPQGSEYFGDTKAFCAELRSRPDADDACWSCAGNIPPLVPFNVAKDLQSLGISARECDPILLFLCPRCAVAYMNSFNQKGQEGQKRKRRPYRWTVQKWLTFCRDSFRPAA